MPTRNTAWVCRSITSATVRPQRSATSPRSRRSGGHRHIIGIVPRTRGGVDGNGDRARAGVDLNSDVGEGFGPWRMGDDAAMLDIVTTANIACGFHAVDPLMMARTVAMAVE